MSKKVFDIFALVKNFLGVDWQPKHIIIGLFKASETIGWVLAKNSIALLDEYGLKKENCCLCLKWRGKLKCNDSGTQVYG